MKLLSDWIILNLGATLAFSALWVAVVVVVAAFMGVRAGFVRVVGWVSGLFARKRDQAPQGGLGVSQWISGRVMKAKWSRSVSIDGPAPVGGYPWPSPVSLQDAVLTKAFAGAAMAHDDRIVVLPDATVADRSETIRRDWRGTGGAREDRETVIEATWQGRGKGFSDPGHVARLDAAFSRGVIHTGGRDTVAS